MSRLRLTSGFACWSWFRHPCRPGPTIGGPRAWPEQLPAAGRAGGLADLAPPAGSPTTRRRRVREVGGVDWDARRPGITMPPPGRDGAPGHPPRPGRRRVVQGGRPHDRLQHLLQLEVVHQHGLRVDPVRLRQRPAPGRQDAVARHQGLQHRVAPGVVAVARPAQGGDHGPEPPEHGLGPGRAEPAGEGSPVRVVARACGRLADGQAHERPGRPSTTASGGRPPGARVPSATGEDLYPS